jgi:hypothetical protein
MVRVMEPASAAGTTKALSPWPVSGVAVLTIAGQQLDTEAPLAGAPSDGEELSFNWENQMKLPNARHEKFAQAFVETGNAASAARAIGHLNFSAQRGSDLLHRPDVQARVEQLMRDRPSLPTRLARRLDADTLSRAAKAVSFLASLV